MAHPIDIHVGGKLREARMAQGLTQDKLGKILGVSFQQIQKYEKGDNRMGSSRLWCASRALNIPVAHLFEGVEESSTQEGPLARRTITWARKIESIKNLIVRQRVLDLIKACADER